MGKWSKTPTKGPLRTKNTTESKFSTETKFATTIAKRYRDCSEILDFLGENDRKTAYRLCKTRATAKYYGFERSTILILNGKVGQTPQNGVSGPLHFLTEREDIPGKRTRHEGGAPKAAFNISNVNMLPLVATGQGEIIYAPPPSPSFWPEGIFKGEGGGVYILNPPPPPGGRILYPPLFDTPPTPRRAFSGVGGGVFWGQRSFQLPTLLRRGKRSQLKMGVPELAPPTHTPKPRIGT